MYNCNVGHRLSNQSVMIYSTIRIRCRAVDKQSPQCSRGQNEAGNAGFKYRAHRVCGDKPDAKSRVFNGMAIEDFRCAFFATAAVTRA